MRLVAYISNSPLRVSVVSGAALLLVSAFAKEEEAGKDQLRQFFDEVVLSFFLNWFSFIKSTFEDNPGHFFTETIAILVIIYLLFQRTYDPSETNKLSPKEQQELIRDWKPEPLVPEISQRSRVRISNTRIIQSSTKKGYVKAYGEQYLNFSSYNFLDVSSSEQIKSACKATIKKYGVGSCGPRGFYGTIDTHLDLEKEFSRFMNTEDSILYADSIACISSVVPSFSKKGDLIICDESVNYSILQGIQLSRSNVIYFKHNDMNHLEQILNSVKEKDILRPFKAVNRRFIVVEGLYQNQGDIAPLDKIVELKYKHKYRLILDDTMAIGVLGRTGHGSVEHWGLKIISVALDTSISSVGGICTGSKEIVDHQRLSGVGYVFSASSPPYTCTAAIEAIKLIEQEPERCTQVRENASKMRHMLGDPENFSIFGDKESPIILIHLSDSLKYVSSQGELELFEIAENLLFTRDKILVGVSTYIPTERKAPRPSLRVLVSAGHSSRDIEKSARLILSALDDALKIFNDKLENDLKSQ